MSASGINIEQGRGCEGKTASDGERNELRKAGEPDASPLTGMSDHLLFVIQMLLDGESSKTFAERQEIYRRCSNLLAQISSTPSDPEVRSRCSELQARLKEREARDSASNDVTSVQEAGVASLRERVQAYVCLVIQAVADADDKVSEADRNKMSGMCLDMLACIGDEDTGECQLRSKVMELKDTCESVAGLQPPVDDLLKEVGHLQKPSGDDSGDTVAKVENQKRRESFSDMPPLEEVF